MTIDLEFVLRLYLGIVFLPAGLGKLTNRDHFSQNLLDYKVLPSFAALTFARILPWLEIAVGLAFFSGLAVRFASIIAGLLLASFIAALIVNLKQGRSIACSCYGVLGNHVISWGTVTRNTILLLLATILVLNGNDPLSWSGWIQSWRQEIATFQSLDTVVLVGFLTVFCVVALRLVEDCIRLLDRGLAARRDTASGKSIAL